MELATYSEAKSTHPTLTGAGVDTVTLTEVWEGVEIINRVGDSSIYINVGSNGAVPSDPTVGGDDTEVVVSGSSLFISTPGSSQVVVKVIGNGNEYSVTGVRE